MAFFRRTLRITTRLTPEEVRAKLREQIAAPSLLTFDLGSSAQRAFRGTVDGDAFHLVSRVQWRNSFAPVVTGKLVPFDGGTQVDLSLDLHGAVFVFLALWTLIAGAGSYVLLTSVYELTLAIAAAAIAFPLVGVVIGYLGFELEAPKTIERLEALLR